MLDHAARYLAHGLIPIPIPEGQKGPQHEGWQTTTAQNALAAFRGPGGNLGVLLGPSGIVDVDLDVPEALPFARALLPPTACFGRPGNPESHWWYRCPAGGYAKHNDVPRASADPEARHLPSKTLVELRAGNAQTVAPPSVHPSGEAIEWVRPLADIVTIDAPDIARRVSHVAAGALMVRHWPAVSRHEAQLALAGCLCDAGLPQEDAASFLTLVCEGAGDANPGKREATIRSTFEARAAGRPIAAWKSLAGLLGRDVTDKLRALIGSPEASFAIGDHLELAQRLVAQYPTGEILSAAGEMWAYDRGAGVWAPLDKSRLVAALGRYHRAPVGGAESGKPRQLKIDHREISAVPKVVAAITERPRAFEGAAAGLAFADGILSLDASGDLRMEPLAPTHFQRHSFGFRLTDAPAPETFRRFLAEVLSADDAPFLQEWVGAALFGLAPRYETAVIFLGAGANGKSTLAGAIEGLFPAGSTRAVPPQRWSEDQHLAQLAGATLNVVGEMPGADLVSTEIVKQVITGEPVQAKRVYREPFTFRPRAAHLFLANFLPAVRDLSPGFWRRFAVLHFAAHFPPERADVALPDKLRAERPGIALWGIEGAQRLVRRGRLAVPPSSIRAVEEWRAHADAVACFLASATRPGRSTPTQLFTAFQGWSRAQGFSALTSRTFGERLALLGHPSVKSNGVRHVDLAFDPGKADRDDAPTLRLVPGGAS